MYQLPVRAKSADPANLGTADCALFCHCDDGSDYAVKNGTSGDYVQHSEWFCKHLGDMVGIASPDCRIVDVSGELCFGSRWESYHDPVDWWLKVKNGEYEIDRVSPTISRIFAFDLFVNNVDRHATNYIVRPQIGDKMSFLAFDHSRAWMAAGWPLAPAPMQPSVSTRGTFKMISGMVGGMLNVTEALFVTQKLREVNLDYVNRILTQEPGHWLSQSDRDRILNFWQSTEFTSRINRIEEGFNNGEYV